MPSYGTGEEVGIEDAPGRARAIPSPWREWSVKGVPMPISAVTVSANVRMASHVTSIRSTQSRLLHPIPETMTVNVHGERVHEEYIDRTLAYAVHIDPSFRANGGTTTSSGRTPSEDARILRRRMEKANTGCGSRYSGTEMMEPTASAVVRMSERHIERLSGSGY